MIVRAPSYIYGMDKYSGCNVVESVVTPAPKAKVKRRGSALAIKIVISCVVVGLLAFVAFAPIQGLQVVKDALKTVLCYDLFGRSDIGSLPILAGVL